MSSQNADKILTRDEIEFIRDLFKEEPASAAALDGISSLVLSENEQSTQLVSALMASCNLELKADIGAHRYIFPFEMVPRQSGQMQLELAVPHIYEVDNNTRSWRFRPYSGELQLTNYEREFTTPSIVNISKSGICIRDSAPKFGTNQTRCQLNLQLPDYELPVSITCNIVRLMECPTKPDFKQIAFEFDESCPQVNSTISRYLFNQHRQNHNAG